MKLERLLFFTICKSLSCFTQQNTELTNNEGRKISSTNTLRVAFGIVLSFQRNQGNVKDHFLENALTRCVIVKMRYNSNIPLLNLKLCLYLFFIPPYRNSTGKDREQSTIGN